MPTVMNDRMISGSMNDRKVENSEVKVASRRMMVTKNAVSAMPNHCPHIPMRIPAMMPIISRINSPNCFTYIYSSFSQNMKLLLQPECAGWTRIFSADKAFFCSNPWDYKGKQRSMREKYRSGGVQWL